MKGPIASERWKEWLFLEREKRRLEKQQEEEAARADNWDWDQYQIACTCPPSTTICIRGGRQWSPPTDGGWLNPGADKCIDIATDDDFIFTNANWYTFRMLKIDWFDTLLRYCDNEDEYETAAEAEEAAMLSYCRYTSRAGFWAAILIIRNNGIIGLEGQYRRIEPVNRGNSYLWRDSRAIHLL